ncbi:hypothetical protein Tco_0711820, partial [Tanacetum coccineum]
SAASSKVKTASTQLLLLVYISTASTNVTTAGIKVNAAGLQLLEENVKAGLATLGLFDEDDPSLSSFNIINSSLVKVKYFSPIWKVLMQYIVKCVGGMHGSHDQLNANQRIIAFCLCWGLNVDIADISSFNSASPVVKSFVNSSEMLENQENNKSKSDKGYHAVPPPFTGNFMPRKTNLTFMDEIVKSENLDVTTVVTPSNVKTVNSNLESAGVKNNGDVVEPKTVRKNSFRLSVIEDWNSGDKVSFEHLHYVCDKKVIRPVVEQLKKGESKNFAK